MPEQTEEGLVETVVDRQIEVSGRALPLWLIEAQLQVIEDRLTAAGTVLERRIGEGKFLAIGALATVSASIALGMLIHPSAVAAAAWKFRRLLYLDRDWRPHIIAIYVELEGVDRDVFEAIHWLSLEPFVVNFDKYESEDFASAFGVEAPDLPRVVTRVELDVAAVSEAIARLVRAEVLKTDGRRYWIAF